MTQRSYTKEFRANAAQKADNLLNRDFNADASNKKLVTDITQFVGCDGRVYM